MKYLELETEQPQPVAALHGGSCHRSVLPKTCHVVLAARSRSLTCRA